MPVLVIWAAIFFLLIQPSCNSRPNSSSLPCSRAFFKATVMLFSEDGGQTWSKTYETNIAYRQNEKLDPKEEPYYGWDRFLISPTDAHRIFAILNGGAFTSPDAGRSWSRLSDTSIWVESPLA